MRRNTKAKGDMNRQAVFDFIQEFIASEGYPPSIQEICDGTGLASKSSVHWHLDILEEEGKIERRGKDRRWIYVNTG